MHALRIGWTLALLVAALPTSRAVGAPAGRAAATACPAWAAELRAARAALARGDRQSAVLALRRGRAALDACLGGAAPGERVAAAGRARG